MKTGHDSYSCRRNYFLSAKLCCALLLITGWISAQGATITWTNTAGGNWSAAANWTPNQVPGDGDTAVLPDVGNSYAVNLDVPASVSGVVVGTASGGSTQTFLIAGQTLTLNGPATVNPNGQFNISSGALAGQCTLAGTLDWSGGQLNAESTLTIGTNGVMNIEGSIEVYGAVTNEGTVNWEAGDISMLYYIPYGYTGEIWNETNALWNIQCDQTVYYSSFNPPTFNNAGDLLKSGGSGTTSFNINLNNTGMVEAQNGTIQFDSGGSLGGNLIADSGAGLDLAGGTFTPGPAWGVSGAGTVTVTAALETGPSFTLTNALTVDNLTITGTMLVGAGGVLNWSGGQLDPGADLTIGTNGVMNIEGSIDVYGAVTNEGTVNWDTGAIAVYDFSPYGYNGEIWNETNALWNIQCDQTVYYSSFNPPTFNNAGDLLKSGGSGTTSFNINLNNTGMVEAQNGTIQFDSGGSLGGNLIADSGAGLDLAGGTFTPGPAWGVSGAGTVTVTAALETGPSFTLTNALTVDNLTITGTMLVGAGGVLNWSGGQLDPGADLTIGTNGVMNIEGSIDVYGAVTNEGTVNWEAGDISMLYYSPYGYTGEIWNETNALWNIQCDQTVYYSSFYPPTFNNAGDLLKSGGRGTTSFNINLNNTGMVEAQNGTIQFDSGGNLGGNLIADSGAGLDLAGGTFTPGPAWGVSGAGTVTVTAALETGPSFTLTNALTVDNLTITGTMLVGAGGVLNWSGGQLDPGADLTIGTNGVMNIEGSIDVYGAVTNEGTVNWDTGAIAVYDFSPYGYNGEIWNETNALWNIQCDQTVYCPNPEALPMFNNAGSLVKSGGSGTTSFSSVYLNNTGTVEADVGVIDLPGGVTLSGGILNFGIDSLTQYGRISIPGEATLDGTISVTLQNGFNPKVGDAFLVMSYGSETGAFTNLNLPTAINWQANYGPIDFTLDVANPNANIFTWTGMDSSDWFDPNNWSPTGVPGTNDTVNVEGGTINLTAPVVVNGQLNWVGGSLSGSALTVAGNGVLNILGDVSLFSPLINEGTVNWEGGEVSVYYYGYCYGGNGEIWNETNALWDIQCDQTMSFGDPCGNSEGEAVFHNAGSLFKSADGGTTSFGLYLDNTGAVEAQNGTIAFSGGSDFGGSFQADTNAAIYFDGGSETINGPPNFEGSGTVEITGGSVTLAGPLANWDVNGGTVSGLGQVSGTINFYSGNIAGANSVNGVLNWYGGQLDSGAELTVLTNAVMNIEGNIDVYGEVTNCGTVNWEGGEVSVYYYGYCYGGNGEIWNETNALWDIQCDQTMSFGDPCGSYAVATFHNAGNLLKSADGGTTSFGLYLDNTGAVEAQNGAIDFNGGSDFGGSFQADTNAAIYFDGGSETINGPPNFEGSGTVEITGGSVTLAGPLANWDVDGGTVSGLGQVSGTINFYSGNIAGANSVNGVLNWYGGQLDSGAELTVLTNAVMNIEGNIDVYGEVTNCGTVNWEGGEVSVYYYGYCYGGNGRFGTRRTPCGTSSAIRPCPLATPAAVMLSPHSTTREICSRAPTAARPASASTWTTRGRWRRRTGRSTSTAEVILGKFSGGHQCGDLF